MFETFVILLAILLPIKSPVASAALWIAVFKAVVSASKADCLTWSKNVWLYLLHRFLVIYLPIFLPILLTKDKIPQPSTNMRSLGWTE